MSKHQAKHMRHHIHKPVVTSISTGYLSFVTGDYNEIVICCTCGKRLDRRSRRRFAPAVAEF
jgi:hypothetical protein